MTVKKMRRFVVSAVLVSVLALGSVFAVNAGQWGENAFGYSSVYMDGRVDWVMQATALPSKPSFIATHKWLSASGRYGASVVAKRTYLVPTLPRRVNGLMTCDYNGSRQFTDRTLLYQETNTVGTVRSIAVNGTIIRVETVQ